MKSSNPIQFEIYIHNIQTGYNHVVVYIRYIFFCCIAMQCDAKYSFHFFPVKIHVGLLSCNVSISIVVIEHQMEIRNTIGQG